MLNFKRIEIDVYNFLFLRKSRGNGDAEDEKLSLMSREFVMEFFGNKSSAICGSTANDKRNANILKSNNFFKISVIFLNIKFSFWSE